MKVFLKLKFIGIVIFFWISIYGKAQQTPSQLADSLQAILNNSLPTNFSNSGAIMSITVPGLWSWSGSTGYSIAGITSGQNQMLASSSNQFRVGSITKMMLATCILKLQEMGQLSIEDPISLYLRSTLVNDTIQSSGIVKIRHLLNHTSGIANSADNTTCQMDVLNNPTAGHTLEDAIFCGASQGEVFPPEFAWAYSNTNYSILAMIINHVSGMDYRDFVQQTIFSPLNMSQTFIPTANVISDSHMGCYWNMGSWIDLTIINPTTYAGWADVVSTTNDLILYYAALRNGQIINAASFQLMQTMFPGTYDYGLGYDHYLFSGVNYDGHYGEVANTSGLFFANTNSQIAPNGYYIAYNFNTQGADMIQKIDLPVFNLLNGSINTSGIETVNTPLKVEVFPNPVTTEVTISNESAV
ncbi:MAG: beta-lactamase family protein [Flavobacteriia bacterium]|nr:beta-lactamase family protein [Flavobacteriia bacterium]